jgi:hypothetical protein
MEKVNFYTSLNVVHVNSTSSMLYVICKFQLIFFKYSCFPLYIFSYVFKLKSKA